MNKTTNANQETIFPLTAFYTQKLLTTKTYNSVQLTNRTLGIRATARPVPHDSADVWAPAMSLTA